MELCGILKLEKEHGHAKYSAERKSNVMQGLGLNYRNVYSSENLKSIYKLHSLVGDMYLQINGYGHYFYLIDKQISKKGRI